MNDTSDMNPARQARATITLGSIFFLRMFGLFLLVPVLSLYAVDLAGATPFLIGAALGIYGLTQGLLQIPLGMLSDHIGRKPVIFGGLCLFIAGSVIAAQADHIYLVILGRALQGAGAIAAAIMALLADITSEQYRTRSMAVIGMSVGMAFILAMVLGPVLGASIGLAGLFYTGAVLASIAIVVLVFVPVPVSTRFHSGVEASNQLLIQVFKNTRLLRYNLGVLYLHIIMMATFVALPLVLRDHTHLMNSQHWHLYLPVLVTSVIIMLPFIILADKKNAGAQIYPAAVVLLLMAQIGLALWHQDLAPIAASLLMFFVAFNYLEASLPAMVSKLITPERKGTALGIYSTCQFMGAFLGGLGGGLCLQHSGYAGVFAFNILVAIIWVGTIVCLKS